MLKHLSQLFRPGFALLLLAVSQQAVSQSANSIYSRVANSVGIVIVTTFEDQLVGSGSAVTVGPQTMVTNRHVLLPGHRYQVLISGGRYEAYMTNCDSVQDLCLMEVRGLNAAPVEFGDASKLSVGDSVYAIGAPNEIANIVGVTAVTKQKTYSPPQLTLSNGLITALRPVEDGNVIQTNAAISPGSSGGGLFDAKGRLIGITTFGMRAGQGLNMALPVNWVERLGVSGAPPSSETNQAAPSGVASERGMLAPAPQQGVSTELPDSDNASQSTTSQPRKSSVEQAKDGVLKYWWAALILPFALIVVIKRRLVVDEDETESSPAVTAVDPQLQRCMDTAREELEQNRADHALWNMVIADHKGNEAAAQQSYIKRRASRLLSEEKDRQWAAAMRQNQTT